MTFTEAGLAVAVVSILGVPNEQALVTLIALPLITMGTLLVLLVVLIVFHYLTGVFRRANP